jgi:hypothetical protein
VGNPQPLWKHLRLKQGVVHIWLPQKKKKKKTKQL